jgi:Family of unknown function (DUF5681)
MKDDIAGKVRMLSNSVPLPLTKKPGYPDVQGINAMSTHIRRYGSLPGGRDPKAFVYDAGYANLGNNTRFRPGQSGNPIGRPKRRQNKPKI